MPSTLSPSVLHLLRTSPLAWLVVADGRVTAASEAADALLGAAAPLDDAAPSGDPLPLVGRGMEELFAPVYGAAAVWPPPAPLAEVIPRRGASRACRLAVSPLAEGEGHLVQVEDLTPLREAEHRGRRGDDLVHTATHVGRFGVWYWDLRSGALEWNGELRELLGVESGVVATFDAFMELVHPEDLEGLRRTLDGVRAGGAMGRLEYRIIRPSDGSVRRVRGGGTTIEREGGVPVRMMGLTQDITDVPAAEELRTRYEGLFQGVPVGLYRTTPEGRLLDANPAFARLVGAEDPAQLIGTDVKELFAAPADRDRWRETLEREGMVVGFEMRLRRVDGQALWVRGSARTVRDAAGDVVYYEGGLEDVTAAHGAQAVLEHSQERQRVLLENASEGYSILDEHGVTLFSSNYSERMLGIPRDAWVGSSVFDHVHPEDFASARQAFTEVVGTPGSLDATEVRVRHADGGYRLFRLAVHNMLHHPAVRGIVLNARDVTEERAADAELRRREGLYRTLATHFPRGVVILLDADLRVRLASGDGLARHGVLSRELEGERLADLVERPGMAETLDMARQAVQGEAVTREVDHGGRIYLQTVVPVRGEGGALERVLITAVDISEVKEAERRLRSSERFLQATLDALPEHVAIVDRSGRIVAVNAAWRAFGAANGWQGPEDACGISYLAVAEAGALAGAEQAAEVLRGLRDVLAGRTEVAYVEYACHSPRERRWFSVTLSSFLLDGVAHAVVSHTNITARHELEEQLRHAQKMEAVGRLAGGIAHDFNNILTSILGHTALADGEPGLPDSVRQELEEVRRSGERAAALTQQLLAFSRKQVLQPRLLDLNGIVSGMEGMLHRLLGADVALEVRKQAGLCCVRADPNQLEQVILNLAINAREAMPEGGVLQLGTAEVVVAEGERSGTLAPGRWVALHVNDSGQGMSPEVEEHVFEPFFTTKPAGTGLGLATVYGIVKQSGGEIEVTSQPGVGTTFRVFLPHVDAEPDPLPVRSGVDERPRGMETILVVEDEDAVRAFAVKALERQGYTVLAAGSGAEALALMAERDTLPDLLLTDVVMPEMNGPELVRRLSAAHGELPVLFTSGYTEDQVVNRSGAATGIHFLPKPFSPGELARVVREVLDGARP